MCANMCQLLSAFVYIGVKGLKERGFVQINELQHPVCRSRVQGVTHKERLSAVKCDENMESGLSYATCDTCQIRRFMV